MNMASMGAALPTTLVSGAVTQNTPEARTPDTSPAAGDGCAASQSSVYSESDDDLPPLEQNRNRPIREYEYTDDETSDED